MVVECPKVNAPQILARQPPVAHHLRFGGQDAQCPTCHRTTHTIQEHCFADQLLELGGGPILDGEGIVDPLLQESWRVPEVAGEAVYL
jgi:hypothetical protein